MVRSLLACALVGGIAALASGCCQSCAGGGLWGASSPMVTPPPTYAAPAQTAAPMPMAPVNPMNPPPSSFPQ